MTGKISEDVDIGTPVGTEVVPVVTGGTNKRTSLDAIKTWLIGTLTKSSVGLSGVDNTSDAAKPVSTATATALALKEALANKNVAGGYAGLDGAGLLLTSVLPAMAISSINVVASQAAMLALTAEQGDIAVRTDLNKTFALATNSPGTLADWIELLTPTGGAVSSVAGLTGAITAVNLKTALTLVAADVGLGVEVLTTPTLLNSWVEVTGAGSSLKVSRVGKVVHLRGLLNGGTAALAFNLPAGWQPDVETALRVPRVDLVSTAGVITISAGGDVTIPITFTNVPLDGIAFLAA